MARGLSVHAALLVVAAGASAYVWTRDKAAAATAASDVLVWPERPEDLQQIAFESNGHKVVLEAQSDAHGRWFQGTAETPPPALPDAGAPDAGPRNDATPKTSRFVSVSAAQKIASGLAPLKAFREIGRVDDARAKEFGFQETPATLVAKFGGRERRLFVGGPTPGGADRYVREAGSGYVYAVKGEVFRELDGGEPALVEHDPHGFEDADLGGAVIRAKGKTREALRRGPPGKRIWSDPASPDQADETLGNWFGKVDRLRAIEYVADAPAGSEPIVRIDYKVKGEAGDFLELVKGPGTTAGKPDYFMRTERTRSWTKVYGAPGEQVDQDVGSVVK
ncbi:MAG: DUF4340 domain-containing protein [Myxococcales bacterium]|nr:DUF4340 domain-containing protein [Myxococcales bacterium]